MITVKPSKETYHCHCECGAEFFAFENDITRYNIVVYDRFGSNRLYEPIDYPNMLDNVNCDIIKCPFCGNFVIINDNGYNIREKDVRNDFDKNNFNKIKYKIENSSDISIMTEKYPQLLKDTDKFDGL